MSGVQCDDLGTAFDTAAQAILTSTPPGEEGRGHLARELAVALAVNKAHEVIADADVAADLDATTEQQTAAAVDYFTTTGWGQLA